MPNAIPNYVGKIPDCKNDIYLVPGKVGSSKKRRQNTHGLIQKFRRLDFGKLPSKNYFYSKMSFFISFIGSESKKRLVMISMDKHPTFIGLINEFCNISTLKQMLISTLRSNHFTMPEIDLRLLYEADDLSDQTGL